MTTEQLQFLCQVILLPISLLTIWLAGSSSRTRRRLAGVIGMCNQPFWFLTTYLGGQWAIMLLTVVYTFCWFRMFRNNRNTVEVSVNVSRNESQCS